MTPAQSEEIDRQLAFFNERLHPESRAELDRYIEECLRLDPAKPFDIQGWMGWRNVKRL